MVSWQVSSTERIEYSVIQTSDLLSVTNEVFAHKAELIRGSSRLLIVDEQVSKHFGDAIGQYMKAWSIDYSLMVLQAGEAQKSWASVDTVLAVLEQTRLRRRSEPVIAIGGGVLTDIVGLACSLYRRGIPYIRVPTTLIGMIDAGVGVKTGVNRGASKNRVGSYYPAKVTIIDPQFLRTLPTREVSNGLAEVLKIAVVADPTLYKVLQVDASSLLATHLTSEQGQLVMTAAISAMLRELAPNLHEIDLRRRVDFGHTFGPGLELAADPALLHGEAVAIDMALSLALGVHKELTTSSFASDFLGLLQRLGLPTYHPLLDVDHCTQWLTDAVLHRDGAQHLPLPIGEGEVLFVEDLTNGDIDGALRWLRDASGRSL